MTHSLAELLHKDTPAADVLSLKICEPALGSGAFLVEAVNQLAAQYLTRRQSELGATIPPEDNPAELQKVKAYLALHNCYGVDLNATAVELAEITLWLVAMHPGLRAPWFGLHLRRGSRTRLPVACLLSIRAGPIHLVVHGARPSRWTDCHGH